MVTHPTGVSIDILGIERGDQGHSCKEHDIYGSILSTDVIIHLQKLQWLIVLIEGDCCMFDVVSTIEHDCCLFYVVVVITIKRGDQGHSCKEHDI